MRELAGHPIAIDHLTILGASVDEMVEIAAGLEVGLIGPISALPGDLVAEPFDLRPGTSDFAAMKAALARTGVRINNVDGATLAADVDWDDMASRVDGAAELGARGIVTLCFDRDRERFFDGYCRLGELTRGLDLLLILEFTPLSGVADLAAARAVVERGGYRHARVLPDLMHLMHSGGHPADIAGCDAGLISGAQFCDGLVRQARDEYLHDALKCRELPGNGEFPVTDFVRALPPGLPLALEIPRAAERDAGTGPAALARRAVEATLALADRFE